MRPAQLAVDVGIAVACLLLRWAIGLGSFPLWVVVIAMAGALALRRASPGLALAIAWAGAVIQMSTHLPPDISNIAVLAVLFTTARYGGRRTSWLGLASAIVGAILATAYMLVTPYIGIGVGNSAGFRLPGLPQVFGAATIGLAAALALLGLSWTLGLLARTWSTARESRRSQAAAEQTVVVEQERNRIARDMHDVVAHSLAVVIAQADGARYATGVKAKDDALGTIASTGREALADVRLLLGQLRHSEEAGPQPMLTDLERLFEQLRASGLVIVLRQHGDPLPLPAGQQLALYRIVQEALTNALRHGDTAEPVDVELDWTRDAATATISSVLAAPSAAAPAAGHGIAGMRERAILVGGTLTAAPVGNRFVVDARIPVSA
ncbi:MAG: sensor histidine kinase [Rhodoglobus sp.]|nr:sensor histidine kinase [Rhodoglobus sp.]